MNEGFSRPVRDLSRFWVGDPILKNGAIEQLSLAGQDKESQCNFSPRFSIVTKSAIRWVRVSVFLAVVMRKKKL